MEGSWVEGTTDRITSRGEWTLWILHIEASQGKGFMPQIKKDSPDIGFCNGPEFIGTDETWYKTALAYGRVMLNNFTSS